MSNINERVREIRKEKGLTLEKFGEPLGVKKSVLSSLENGKSGVTDQMVKSICVHYYVNEEWLRTGIGEKYVEFPKEDKLSATITKLTPYKHIQEALSDIAELDDEYKKALDTFLQGLYKKQGE